MACTNQFCNGHLMASVISEYRVSTNNSNVANSMEVKKLFVTAQPFGNHNAGGIYFGPDGYLYILFGDGGSANDPRLLSQNIDSPMGKALRIDVDGTPDAGKNYKVPANNPFPSWKINEAFALGFRNPWRCSFDLGYTNYLMCGDVGQDNIEELDVVVKGGNYGWRRFEGTRLNFPNDPTIQGAISPILEYTHADFGANPSSIGGYIYRGLKDDCIWGWYVYADLASGFWSAIENPLFSGIFSTSRITLACADNVANCGTGIVFSFGEDDERNLYIASAQRLLRVVDRSRCGLPTCNISRTFPFPQTQATQDIQGTVTTPYVVVNTAIHAAVSILVMLITLAFL